MDPKMKFISEKFDLRKFKELCNALDCEQEPKKQIDILEVKAKGVLQKRGLVSLYLCNRHIKSIGLLVRNISKFAEKGIVIRVEEKKLEPSKARYVTF